MSFTDAKGRKWLLDLTHRCWIEVTLNNKLRKMIKNSVKYEC